MGLGRRTRGRGTRGFGDAINKQHLTFASIIFGGLESSFMLESLLVVADGFQRPRFGRTFLLAYLIVRTLDTE